MIIIALLIYITNTADIYITNPVNLTNLAPHTHHVDRVDHANLYILKEPLNACSVWCYTELQWPMLYTANLAAFALN